MNLTFKKAKFFTWLTALALSLSILTTACTTSTQPSTDLSGDTTLQTGVSTSTSLESNDESASLITDESNLSTSVRGESDDSSSTPVDESQYSSTEASAGNETSTETITTSSEASTEVSTTKSSKAKEDTNLPPSSDDTLEVHFLNVKQAASVLFIQGDTVMLVDGGDRGTSSFLVAYLKKMGIEEIDVMIATHYDADHISGLVGVLNAFDVDVVYTADYVGSTKIYQSFINAVGLHANRMLYPQMGQIFDLADMQIRFIAPSHYNHREVNDNSISIHVSYKDSSLVIMGDQSANAEQQMLKQELNADVYFASHHGANGSNSKTLLEAVSPQYVVISSGANNSYGHPGQNSLNRFANVGAEIFRTDELGTILLRTDGHSYEWTNYPNNDYVRPVTAAPVPTSAPSVTTTVAPTTATSSTSTAATTSTTTVASTTAAASTTTAATTQEATTTAATSPPTTQAPTTQATTLAPTTAETTTTAAVLKLDYVLNTNTKKFHIPSCHSVDKMNEENKKHVHDSRDSVITQGYDPCGNCKP